MTYLRGHTLAMGGQPYDADGHLIPGDARHAWGWVMCQCGTGSPLLKDAAARARWHDQHRDDLRPPILPPQPIIRPVQVGKCGLCGRRFHSQEEMAAHYQAIRLGKGCHPPEVRLPE